MLPWLTFSLLLLAMYVRLVLTQSLSVLREPYVTVAHAKGASERQVLTRHVVPSVVSVVAAMVAMDVGTALGIALFVEVVYGLPGLGRLLIVALQGFSGNAADRSAPATPYGGVRSTRGYRRSG